MGSVRDYLTMIEQNVGSPEWQKLISAFTVNHTAFFREKYHFDILAEFFEARKKKPISVWCCASSTGEEPYSIAITMHEACRDANAGMSVLASRQRSEEHTSELQSLIRISYAVFCLKKKQ